MGTQSISQRGFDFEFFIKKWLKERNTFQLLSADTSTQESLPPPEDSFSSWAVSTSVSWKSSRRRVEGWIFPDRFRAYRSFRRQDVQDSLEDWKIYRRKEVGEPPLLEGQRDG